jgi:FAD:protein FMN transferase
MQLRAVELTRYEWDEPHMGTIFRIVIHADDKEKAITAVTAAFKRIRELEGVMSDYKASSEVMKLCAANDKEPGKQFAISEDLATVLSHSIETSKLSDGAFDVTIGPLSKLWREVRKTKQLPNETTRKAEMAKVGWKNIELNREKKTVQLKLAGMRLDFGGIGKGFAADEALAVLKKHGFPKSLVAAAGDITVGDAPPNREAWHVEIEPLGKDQPKKTVKLVNASVSTSGDLFQFVEIDGRRYSHVLDPKSGLGLMGNSRATVIAPKGYQADSITKMLSVMKPDEVKKRLESQKSIHYYLIAKPDESSAKESIVQSPSFAKLMVEQK